MTAVSVPTNTEGLIGHRLDTLLSDHDPATTDPATFWGAQFDLGLAWVEFPEGLGGLGADVRHQADIDARLAAAGAPENVSRNLIGVRMMPPTLLTYADRELQARHLRRAFTCEDIWCQLFSEPGAGSDLASLATRAERDGDEWVVNGQKVWTTLAHVAHYGLLLARTDPTVPKHRGLTYFIVDMRTPGVEVRPLRQITGEAEYNEVYFTDVRIPDSHRLGGVGDGWRAAMTTLMNERVAVEGFGRTERGMGAIRHAVREWRQADPARRTLARRDALTRLWVEAEVSRLTGLRALQLRQQGMPGPEGSIGKIALGLLQQRIYNLCMELRGPAAGLISNYEMIQPTTIAVVGDENDHDLTKAFLGVQQMTIGGGTTEINKTLIAEGVLGLPAEPRPDKTLPWNEVPRS